jgi:hypothetical protein
VTGSTRFARLAVENSRARRSDRIHNLVLVTTIGGLMVLAVSQFLLRDTSPICTLRGIDAQGERFEAAGVDCAAAMQAAPGDWRQIDSSQTKGFQND